MRKISDHIQLGDLWKLKVLWQGRADYLLVGILSPKGIGFLLLDKEGEGSHLGQFTYPMDFRFFLESYEAEFVGQVEGPPRELRRDGWAELYL